MPCWGCASSNSGCTRKPPIVLLAHQNRQMDWNDPEFWLDRLGAAVATGIVAALTALLVGRLTAAHCRRLQLEAEVRAQAIRVMALGKEISAITTTLAPKLGWGVGLGSASPGRHNPVSSSGFMLEAILVPVDVELAKRLPGRQLGCHRREPRMGSHGCQRSLDRVRVRLTNPGPGRLPQAW